MILSSIGPRLAIAASIRGANNALKTLTIRTI